MEILFSTLDVRARLAWAKSSEAGGHSILAHMLDVAAVAEVLLSRESAQSAMNATRLLGAQGASGVRWIAALVGLHDFGKCIPGFQAKWSQGELADKAAGLRFTPLSLKATDHALASAHLLPEYLRRLGYGAPCGMAIGQALGAHHGFNCDATAIQSGRPLLEDKGWQETRQFLFDAYWQTLQPASGQDTAPLSLPAVEWLAGLTSVADWIGSNQEWFPLGERGDSLTEHFNVAKSLAATALSQIGWPSYRALLNGEAECDELIQRMLGSGDDISARPLQVAADGLLASARGPSLLLVEAPMGEGKTELAFLAHLRLQKANHHRGLYVALPTQATGAALFGRALTFLQAFSEGIHLDVQLAQGNASTDERVQHLRGIDGQRGEDVSSSMWFAQRRRALLSPYGVGTIDQALLAVLNVKHHFVRLWGLTNRVVVLDEVHAYDSYTSGLIEVLLQWLKSLGSSVVLMSATLPASRRESLLRAWGVESTPFSSYPRLVIADENGVQSASYTVRELPSIQLESIDEGVDGIADCATLLMQQDGCGAIIVNTVERAQQLYVKLRTGCDNEIPIVLFHARFPADERAQREQALFAIYGRDAQRPPRALLIATQVAEQSLDIDFDYLITDLAPVDLVLQRAGRLHRHRRARPECCDAARLFVAGLHIDHLPDLQRTKWKYVYDPYILGRSWAFLSRESKLEMPEAIDRLVQVVYGSEPLPDDLPSAAKEFIETTAFGTHLANEAMKDQLARNAVIKPDAEPRYAYAQKPASRDSDGLDIDGRTRLGDDAITLIPVHVEEDGWRVHPGEASFDPQQRIDETLARRLYARQLKLSHKALVAQLAAQPAPNGFEEHPLLRHMTPLLLIDGVANVGVLRLRLHKELGVVIEKEGNLLGME